MNVYSPIIRNVRSRTSFKQSLVSSKWIKGYSTSSAAEDSSKPEEIIIPMRIQRGPTDLLTALSSTIGRDPTAPHYKYHDDPYLTPTSNLNKKVFAMAQESGRKAAHWLRQEHSEYFIYTTWDPPMKMKTLNKNAEPFIEAFSPRPNYNENSEVSEDDLLLVMKNSLISDAITIYNILNSKNIPISDESMQQFVQLLCYFNEKDPIPEEWCEERWYRNMNRENRNTTMWKEGGLVQQLFDKIENKTPQLYCAVIQGMCKFFQASKAYDLYTQCKEKNIPLNTGVYNGLLKVVGFLKDTYDQRWELMIELLKDMNSVGLKPDLETLNTCLETLSTMTSIASKERALKVYSEFVKKCKIEPSLATWYHMLNIFCKERGPKSDILYSIMEILKGKTFNICDPKDTSFFVTAMSICRHSLIDVNLARKIHELLLHDSNYNLIGDSYKESVYYRNYLTLHCRHESLDVYMDLYNQFVPHIYCPEPSVIEETIKSIDTNGAIEHIPKIWSHVVMIGQTSRSSIIQMILDTIVNHLPLESTDNNSLQEKPKTIDDVKTLAEAIALDNVSIDRKYGDDRKIKTKCEQLADVAWDVWNKVEENQHLKNPLNWTGAMLGNLIQILVQADRLDDAYVVLQKLQKDTSVIGVPNSADQIKQFSDLALKNKKPSYIVTAASYLSEIGYLESNIIAKEALAVFLNKSLDEINEEVSNLISTKAKPTSENSNIANLLTIATQYDLPSKKHSSQHTVQDSSSTSSSDSNSSSEDEDNDK